MILCQWTVRSVSEALKNQSWNDLFNDFAARKRRHVVLQSPLQLLKNPGSVVLKQHICLCPLLFLSYVFILAGSATWIMKRFLRFILFMKIALFYMCAFLCACFIIQQCNISIQYMTHSHSSSSVSLSEEDYLLEILCCMRLMLFVWITWATLLASSGSASFCKLDVMSWG